jgi:hypothetical protein
MRRNVAEAMINLRAAMFAAVCGLFTAAVGCCGLRLAPIAQVWLGCV